MSDVESLHQQSSVRSTRLRNALAALVLVGVTATTTLWIERTLHEPEGTGRHDDGHATATTDGHDSDKHGDADKHGDSDNHGDSVELTDGQLEEANVALATAAKGKVVETVSLPGEIALNGEFVAHVGPRVGGTVRTIKKRLGDQVKKGDVLAVIDSVDVAEMQGAIRSARERLTLAKTQFDRQKKLYKEKISSQKAYLAAKLGYAEARVEYRSAQRALRAKTGGTGASGGYSLVAPLGGTIVAWHLGVGEVLGEDVRAFTIADLGSVWVNITVYAGDLPRVRIGQRTLVRAEGISEPIEGRISYLSQTVGEITRSATARVVLSNPGEAWRPGLFITAEVEVDEVDAKLVVHDEAVQRLEGKHVVFVREGKKLEARAVVLGRHGHAGKRRVVEVTAGLRPGERYVVKNSFLVKAELGKGSAGHEH